MTRGGHVRTVTHVTKTRDPKMAALSSVEVFSHCKQQELSVLAGSADECELPAGHVLMREGETGAEAFLILSGTAAVSIGGRPVATIGAGETVGEMALIDGRPRTATVVALTDLRVLVIGRRHAAALLDQPGVARGLLEILSARLRDADAGRPARSGDRVRPVQLRQKVGLPLG